MHGSFQSRGITTSIFPFSRLQLFYNVAKLCLRLEKITFKKITQRFDSDFNYYYAFKEIE